MEQINKYWIVEEESIRCTFCNEGWDNLAFHRRMRGYEYVTAKNNEKCVMKN